MSRCSGSSRGGWCGGAVVRWCRSRPKVGRGIRIFPELLGIQRLSTPIIHLPTHMATHSSSHTTLAHTTRITTRERAQQSAVARCIRSLPPFPAACSVELWPAVASVICPVQSADALYTAAGCACGVINGQGATLFLLPMS